MKSNLIIHILLFFTSTFAFSQTKNDFAVIADREMYASGETLFAKIFTPSNNNTIVVYLDLINQNGKRICGASYKISEKQASGYLNLPDSLSTGTYLLIAHQKNRTNKFKAISQIYVVNRFDGFEKANKLSELENAGEIILKNSGEIIISNFENEYKINENISANVELNDSFLNEIDGNLFVKIASNGNDFNFKPLIAEYDFNANSFNETKGIIVSGTVFDKKDNKPAENINVYFSIPDSIPFFKYYTTKADGRFYFLVDNHFGTVNSIVQCSGNEATQRLKIKIDQPIAEGEQKFRFINREINNEQKNAAKELINAVTISKIFEQVPLVINKTNQTVKKDYPFYGIATQVVEPKLFYDLPNFSEISKELLPGVKYRNYNNEPSVFIINLARRLFFTEKPLILIDGVPINNIGLIKDFKSTDIDRIEVCQSERYYGSLRFPGVLAIYTSKPDYSVFPESDQFVRYTFESIQNAFELQSKVTTDEKIPDVRHLLYWNPSLKPVSNIPIIFSTSAVKGVFKISVYAKTKSGGLFYTEKQFEVK